MHSLRRYRALTLLPIVLLIASLLGCSGSGGTKAGPQTATSSAPSAQAVSPAQGGLIGDMDDDGEATVGDAINILRIVVGLDPDDERADANGNGSTDVGDAIKVLRCVVGLDDWPIGGVAQTVGPEGGTVTTADGKVTLEVPAGALQTETDITIFPQSTYPADAGVVPRTCYEFGPDGTQFDQPVQVTIAYDETSVPASTTEYHLGIRKVVGETWEEVAGSTVDTGANTASAPIDGFSGFGVFGREAHAGDQTTGSDGQFLVLVPDGSFMMGSDEFGAGEELPVHEVTLDHFWIGRYEVTNNQFAEFLNDAQPDNVYTWLDIYDPDCGIQFDGVQYLPKSQLAKYPVGGVSWYGAAAYCDHYGYALPTEAQWEYAAAGPSDHTYPWGDEWPGYPNTKCCNDTNRGPFGTTFEVGSFVESMSWCGGLDMAGNVAEWCADWYDKDYYAASPSVNPTGPAEGYYRVHRGASYGAEGLNLRCAHRSSLAPNTGVTSPALGFRCVMNN